MKAFVSALFVASVAGLAVADQACYFDDAECAVNGTCTAATPNTGVCAPAPMGSFATLNKTGTTYTLTVYDVANCTGEPIVTQEAEEGECVTVEIDVVGPVNLRITPDNGTASETTVTTAESATGTATTTGSAVPTGTGAPTTSGRPTTTAQQGTTPVPTSTEAAQTPSAASKTTVSVVALVAAVLAFFSA